MCGIAGLWRTQHDWDQATLLRVAGQMADAIAHRGPDDSGVWADPEAGVGFGHCRLAIVDLSAAGHQPMVSHNDRFVLIYNGEVYNFHELRQELEGAGHRFSGQSDTEVLLEGIAAWGLDATVRRLVGMFAFALWDRQSRDLCLVRDRLGIKPLYWGKVGNAFVFASELKAFHRLPDWRPELDRDVLAAFMRYNYVPAPHCIFKGLFKLQPGTILRLRAGAEPRIEAFWELFDFAGDGVSKTRDIPENELVEQLETLLGDAVRCRMIADVPFGAFLSGGIDSSTVAALMQMRSTVPIKTFAIGFSEPGYNEAPYAKAVANHLGTEHTELHVEPGHALDVIPDLPSMYDEPFADSSQIPTYLVSKLARGHVTVALSGDGGDELFAGYNRYFWANRIWRGVRWMPPGLRRGLAAVTGSLPPGFVNGCGALVPRRFRVSQPADKMRKLTDILSRGSAQNLYRLLVSQWDRPEQVVLGASEPESVLSDPRVACHISDLTAQMQYLDTVTYLPDDILTKLDRASMAVSLEARVPFLDHRVVEFAWGLPRRLLHANGRGKLILRKVLYRHVPASLIERPKMGFGVPLDNWLRGPLRDWAEDLLAEQRLRAEGIFDPAPIQQKWQAHVGGRANCAYHLWTVLMFQAWFEQQT